METNKWSFLVTNSTSTKTRPCTSYTYWEEPCQKQLNSLLCQTAVQIRYAQERRTQFGRSRVNELHTSSEIKKSPKSGGKIICSVSRQLAPIVHTQAESNSYGIMLPPHWKTWSFIGTNRLSYLPRWKQHTL